MATLTICATPPLPTFTSLYESIQSLLTGPFSTPTFPGMPTLPSPMFSGFHSPNIEAVEFAAELQCTQALNLVLALFKPVVDFLGLSLNDILPKIPFLGINLVELLAGDASVFIAQLEGIAIGTILGISSLSNGLYNNYVIPALSALQTYQLLIRSYFAALINTLFGLVNQIAHILGVGALSLPTIPDFAGMFEGFVVGVLSQFLLTVDGISVLPVQIATIIDLIGAALISAFGIPFDFALPDPLFPSLNMPEFCLMEQLKNLYTNFVEGPLQLLLDFILNTLHLSVAIPQICISIAIPDISTPSLVVPKFSLPSIPSVPTLSGPNLALSVALPSISIPGISLPSLSIPNLGNIAGVSVALPSVNAPVLAVPSLAGSSLLLSVGLPGFGLPSFSFPKIGLPTFSIPSLPFPAFNLPSFGFPSLPVPTIPSVPSVPAPNLNLSVAVSANIKL